MVRRIVFVGVVLNTPNPKSDLTVEGRYLRVSKVKSNGRMIGCYVPYSFIRIEGYTIVPMG